MVGTKGAAPFASRMSNERSADELHPRKMERVNGVAPSSQPWQSRILLLNHTRVKWCPQPDSHSNLEFRTLPLCALCYGDKATNPWLVSSTSSHPALSKSASMMKGLGRSIYFAFRGSKVVRASGNAPDPGTHLVRLRL